MKAYKLKNPDVSLKLANKYDCSSLAPCDTELLPNFLRVANVSNTWLKAHQLHPTKFEPKKYGWEKVENPLNNRKLIFDYVCIIGDRLPRLSDIVVEGIDSVEEIFITDDLDLDRIIDPEEVDEEN
ncbi:hypothetical protein FQR65_LT11753 [Abscondita terminalis]|nr:hypothetical protein FQR65_LT11753 [Abscondita terminalis]